MKNPEEEKARKAYREGFAKRLELLRQHAGYSKKELGEVAGIAPNTVSQYTLGQVEPTVYSLFKLCEVLECSADELIEPSYYSLASENPLDLLEFVSKDLVVQVYSKSGMKPAVIFFAENEAMAIEGGIRATKLKKV